MRSRTKTEVVLGLNAFDQNLEAEARLNDI